MRPGAVVSIRVNPRDCMSVVDLMKGSGLNMGEMSFASMVSVVLSGCLEEMRKKNVVPNREGFEYSEVCGPYVKGKRTGKKLAITEKISRAGSEFHVDLKLPTVPSAPEAPEFPSAVERLGISQEEEDVMWARAGELQGKANLTVAERLELEELIQKL